MTEALLVKASRATEYNKRYATLYWAKTAIDMEDKARNCDEWPLKRSHRRRREWILNPTFNYSALHSRGLV